MWVFWRIDYHLATPALAALARTEHIYKDEKFSDHAPITVDYHLIDVLSNMTTDMVKISLADGNSSALITNPDNEHFKYVVMPMRI